MEHEHATNFPTVENSDDATTRATVISRGPDAIEIENQDNVPGGSAVHHIATPAEAVILAINILHGVLASLTPGDLPPDAVA